MNQLKVFALGASILFASTSAMALRAPDSAALRSRPAGSVIDVILNRDASIDQDSKEQAKRERKREKELRKQAHEREKDLREAERERAKDLREAAREREKDRREAERERAKDARERARDHDDD